VVRRFDAWLRVASGPLIAYCLMYDHLHAVIKGVADVVTWVRALKAATTAEARRRGLASDLWRRRFHDRRLSEFDGSVEDAVNYVLDNPVRAGLVERREQWPYSGTCRELPARPAVEADQT
jgi:REP element-mobilizing transposase RayT